MTTLAAQVRKILRDSGAAAPYGMWTNKFEKCRTVKCYAMNGHDADELLIDAAELIMEFCEDNNIKFDMKVIDNCQRSGMLRSVIVRLPLEN